jgi:hypothetical protein
MNYVNTSLRASNATAVYPRNRHGMVTACAPIATPVFKCFVWLDLILPWIILLWLMVRYW